MIDPRAGYRVFVTPEVDSKGCTSDFQTEYYAIIAESDQFPAIFTNTSSNESLMFNENGYLCNTLPAGKFYVTYGGAIFAAEGVTSVHGGPYLQTTGSSGKTVTAYSDHTTAPETDDVGEAQLVNWRAFVPIDAVLADVIDLSRGYHVFVTPRGDSNGLYIAKGAGVFFVREQRGGHSTFPFE